MTSTLTRTPPTPNTTHAGRQRARLRAARTQGAARHARLRPHSQRPHPQPRQGSDAGGRRRPAHRRGPRHGRATGAPTFGQRRAHASGLPTAERTLLAATTGAPLELLGGGGGGGGMPSGDGDVHDGEFVTPIALASAADAAAATAAATVDAANAAIGDAQHVNMGWQPCRACRPLRGDMLVGTRPVAGEGGVPTAATSEARIYRTYSMPRCAC
eukprot:scaffold24430_cov37-Phaeocystis_antarctica.AAC.2